MRSHALASARNDDGLIVLDDSVGARARRWRAGDTTAHLVIGDHTVAPSLEAVESWVEDLAARGFTEVRTGALADGPRSVFARAGFVVGQELVLLRIDPREKLHLLGRERTTAGLRTGRSSVDAEMAAAIDVDAFGAEWGIDTAGVIDACTATPSHRLRLLGTDGYAVTGRSPHAGFVQRLAVRPARQRQGLARILMIDSLEWLRRWRVSTAMVNTHVDNEAALDLYDSLGFTRLDQQLSVMSRSLLGPSTVVSAT